MRPLNSGAMDGLAIDRHPRRKLLEHSHAILRPQSIWTGAKVYKIVASLGSWTEYSMKRNFVNFPSHSHLITYLL